MLFTRQHETEAVVVATVATTAGGTRALSSSVLIDRCSGEHGELSTQPPTKKLRSLTRRTSRFSANGASVATLGAARVAAPTMALVMSTPDATPHADPTSIVAAPNLVLKKSSRFRGVTKHRVTARFEAHLWDKGVFNAKQKKKGRQVYLGAYDDEVSAAKAYDLAALKYWGSIAVTNFKVENYTQQLKEMKEMSRLEFLAGLRRKSNGFSRGLSKFRGVARHHQNGRWEARIGRVEGNKYLYLGTFGTQEEAAEAYDRAAIKYRGPTAVTNFELSRYQEEIEAAQGPKNNASKKSFKDNQISKRHGGHLSFSSQTTNSSQTNKNTAQTTKNTTQSSSGGENLSTTNTINLHLGTNFGAVQLDTLHPPKLLKDSPQLEKGKSMMQYQDSISPNVGETSGLNNTTLKNAKQENKIYHIVSPDDLNIDLEFDYNDDFIESFNF